MQFTFTRTFQKARFSTRFDSFSCHFWLDLAMQTHWSFLRSENSFLKIKFSRLNSVVVTQLHWLKQRPFSAPEHPLFSVCEKYPGFRFEQFRCSVLVKRFLDAHKSEGFRSFLSKSYFEMSRYSFWILEKHHFPQKNNVFLSFAKPPCDWMLLTKN